MKTVTIGTILLAFGLVMTGCGSNTPQETAEKFVISVSKANLEKTNGIATEEVQEMLLNLSPLCNDDKVKVLIKESMTVLSLMDQKVRSGEFNEQLKSEARGLSRRIEEAEKTLKKMIEDKYGSSENIPKSKREEVTKAGQRMMAKSIMPLIDKEFELFGIQTKHPDDIKMIAALFMTINKNGGTRVTYGNRQMLENIVLQEVKEKKEKLTEKCINTYTEFGFVEDVNVLEAKVLSPDKSKVRLELIKKSGKSKKVSVDVEKIRDTWRVSRFYFEH